MELDWKFVLDELRFLVINETVNLKGFYWLTIDTLHGSMYGLNYRYQSLTDVLSDKIKRNAVLQYSLHRISLLENSQPFSFKKRKPLRCKIGIGTYKWDYSSDIIKKAIKMGVSLIDTAEGYGYGKVEKQLGLLLKESPEINVFTKVRRDHMSPSAILRAVDRSISVLNVKPHVQLHFPNDKFPDAINFLADYNNQGKIKSIGLGNCSIDMIEYSQKLITESFGGVINSVQVPFSLLDYRIKNNFIQYCNERGILIIAYSPLGQDFKKLETTTLKNIAKKYEATSAQIALSWVLSHSGVLPIPQTNNLSHLEQNMESGDLYLDSDDVLKLQDYYSKYNIFNNYEKN